MSIWKQSGAGDWAFGYTSLELSGEVAAGDQDLSHQHFDLFI